jgi:hypothetical protein
MQVLAVLILLRTTQTIPQSLRRSKQTFKKFAKAVKSDLNKMIDKTEEVHRQNLLAIVTGKDDVSLLLNEIF